MSERKADGDDWLSAMYEQQARLTEEAVKRVNVLRLRVIELEAQLSGGAAATMTELQDRVTQLEQLLKEARDARRHD